MVGGESGACWFKYSGARLTMWALKYHLVNEEVDVELLSNKWTWRDGVELNG